MNGTGPRFLSRDPTRITHNFMSAGDALRPIATRTGSGQTIDEMWVGPEHSMKLLGLSAVTVEVEKNLATDTVRVMYRFLLNGQVLLERIYEVNYDASLGDLVRERSATIGELK